MLSSDIIERIKNIDSNYVISGSQAVMIYVGHDIRECNDLDIHLKKEVSYEDISKELNVAVDISYEPIPYQIYKGIRLIELEKLLANKLNRINIEFRNKDLYDLYFLLDLKYSESVLVKYLSFKNFNLIINENENVDFSEFYFEIEIEECVQKIKNNLYKIYS